MNVFRDGCPREARLLESGSSCRIINGVEYGTIAKIIQAHDGRLYTLELPSGKHYQYWPEEVRAVEA